MADDEIRYDLLTQDALRGVIRKVLSLVQRSGLPGQHHLYIAFDTEAPGVSVSKRLKEQYPDEMTIVLQHQFWDLQVTNDRFEVKLSFGSVPEKLVVPFQAVKSSTIDFRQATPLVASRGPVSGVPKVAIRPSPMNLSSVP